MAHKVKCRICGLEFDIDKIDQSEWIQPTPRWYYHTRCYRDWKVSGDHTDEDWILLIYDFIARDLKKPYDYHVCEAQRKKYVSQNKFTNKGIYFALKYFYEVKNGDWEKSHNSIGIIPYIYKESCEYWIQLEMHKRGTMQEIERQVRERETLPIQIRTVPQSKKTKAKWSLDSF